MTIEEAGRRTVVTDTFLPDGPDAAVYAAHYEQFRRLYGSLRATQKRLARLSFPPSP